MQPDQTPQKETDLSTTTVASREKVSPSDTTEVMDALTKLPPGVPAVWPPPQRDYRRRERLPRVVMILLSALALLLLISGLGLITYSTTTRYTGAVRRVSTAQAVATGHVIGTAQGQQQATVHAVNTVQAGINATATSEVNQDVTATASVINATATASVLNDLYQKATKGTPKFSDPLSSNSATSLWTEGSSANNAGCVFDNGAYHARETQPGYLQPCIARATQFNNFAYQVNMTIAQGNEDQAGLLFHVDSSNQAYYFFRVGTDGSYALDVYASNNQVSTLIQGLNSAIATSQSQSNQLTVIAQNNTYYLYVNAQPIASLSDSTLSAGKIGVAVVDVDTPIDVIFSNAQVWPL